MTYTVPIYHRRVPILRMAHFRGFIGIGDHLVEKRLSLDCLCSQPAPLIRWGWAMGWGGWHECCHCSLDERGEGEGPLREVEKTHHLRHTEVRAAGGCEWGTLKLVQLTGGADAIMEAMRCNWHHHVKNVRARWQYFDAMDYRPSPFLELDLNADRWQRHLELDLVLRNGSIVTRN